MDTTINRRTFIETVGAFSAGIGLSGPRACLVAAETPKGAPHAERLGWRLACNAYSFNKLTFYETIDKVAALGLKWIVGFNWQKLDPKTPGAIFSERMSAAERQETKKRLRDAGIKLVACYCRDLAHEDVCRRVFDFAREMGMEMLDGEPPVEAFDMLDKLCNEYQINLAVHNHTKPSKYWSPETLLGIFQGRSRRIGACCDTGHWTRSGLPSVETLAKFQGRVLTFDLKDVNEQGACMPFGTGKGDIRGILKELQRQRFRGVVGIEYGLRSPEAEGEIAQCVAFFEKVARELCDSCPTQSK